MQCRIRTEGEESTTKLVVYGRWEQKADRSPLLTPLAVAVEVSHNEKTRMTRTEPTTGLVRKIVRHFINNIFFRESMDGC